MKYFLVAVSAIALGATSANAAVITRTYSNVSTFTAGPLTNLTLTYTVTFDPASPSTPPVLNALTSSSSLASFAGPNGAEIFREGGNSFLAVGGLANFGVQNTGFGNDFFTFFRFDQNGNVVSTAANAVSYFVPSLQNNVRSATSFTTAVVTAPVPEPATWAMLIGGFAVVGAGMRRRRTKIAFA